MDKTDGGVLKRLTEPGPGVFVWTADTSKEQMDFLRKEVLATVKDAVNAKSIKESQLRTAIDGIVVEVVERLRNDDDFIKRIAAAVPTKPTATKTPPKEQPTTPKTTTPKVQ